MAGLKDKQHLFFDLDDTLWDFKKNSSVVLQSLFHEFGLAGKLNVNFEQFLAHYRAVNLDLWSQYQKRQINKQNIRDQRFNLVFNFFGYDNHDENLQVTEKYIARTPHSTDLVEGCLETLTYLQKNYKLHLITNGFAETQNIKLDGCGLRPYFERIIISEAHNLLKPEPAIFKLAEDLAGVQSNACVMIGDSFDIDIEGARDAGWETVYISSENWPGYQGHYINRLPMLKELF